MLDDTPPHPVRPRPTPPAWAGDVLAAALVASAAFAPIPDPLSRPATPLALGLALVPVIVLVLPIRRRRPGAALVACVVVYVAACAAGLTSPGVLLAIVVTMYAFANRMPRRAALVALGVTDVVVAVSTAFAADDLLAPRIFQAAVVIALAAVAGDAARSRREYLEAVTERALRAEETREAEARRAVSEERLRIARDLHDVVAHQISVISLKAGVASSALDARPDRAREALATIRAASRAVLGDIGDLLAVLRTADDTASAAPPPGLERLDDLVASFRSAGLDVVAQVDGVDAPLPAAVDAVAFRVVQEGLTNALKHGSEQRAHVLVEKGRDGVRVVVTNPVARARAGAEASGYGLVGLRERVAVVRGGLETTHDVLGFRLEARLPVVEQVRP